MNIRSEEIFICDEDYPIVATTAGKYHGYVDGDVFTFKGMEYAWADRFCMPEAPKPFEGVKDAFEYGYGCPEMTYNLKGKIPGMTPIQPARYWNMDEHVQYLNVWTKSIEPGVKKPVMFWIHGGGFAGGAANHMFIYEGWALAHTYDVVVVSINHRLNMLGYLDLSKYGEKYKHSGNHGQADIVAALQWVKENIANFGGDPDNVTLFGQSGGGGKISTLMQMKAADGLYNKVIIQSGIMGMSNGPAAHPELGELTVKELGLPEDDISAIETIDYDELAAAVTRAADSLGLNTYQCWAPIPDGDYFIGDPRVVGFRKETADIPVLIGSDLAEFMRSPVGKKAGWSEEKKMAPVRERFGEEAEKAAAAFVSAYPEMDKSYAACVDAMVRPATLDWADRRKKDAAAPVFNYVFAFENTVKGGQLTGHGGEMHFAFHNAFLTEGMRKAGVTARLQDEMAGAWTQFAYAGNPNSPHLPYWKEYTSETHACMVFGDHTRGEENHDRELVDMIRNERQKDPVTGK